MYTLLHVQCTYYSIYIYIYIYIYIPLITLSLYFYFLDIYVTICIDEHAYIVRIFMNCAIRKYELHIGYIVRNSKHYNTFTA